MSEEILINATDQETRVALVDNGILQEIHIEREHSRGIVGNIYLGKVVRILPGIQSAFVDIGFERTAFLHQADIYRVNQENQELKEDLLDERVNVVEGHSQTVNVEKKAEIPPIQELLHEGQKIVVQIIKDPAGNKGARLTTALTIPARNLVYMPYSYHIGVSQKIQSEEERARLKTNMTEIIQHYYPEEKGGYIVRTVAEGISRDDVEQDIRYLQKLWQRISNRIDRTTQVGLIHEDIALLMRFMRDIVHENIERIRVDNESSYQRLLEFAQEVMPEIISNIEWYQGNKSIFELYNIDEAINDALKRTVSLKSGGYLVIDRTEAMTTIDVNTGGYVGRRNMEETLFKTNLEAAQAIALQLRLRNLSGIIIIDFIDMKVEEHKKQVLEALEASLSQDRLKNNITEVSSLGLVEVTRKRVRESLDEMLCETCPVCHGKGMVKTPETICYEIFHEIIRQVNSFKADKYLVIASNSVIEVLMNQESQSLQNLQDMLGKSINLQVDNLYAADAYDVVLF